MSTELKTVSIDFLKPNPFRDPSLELDEERIQALEDSMRSAGVWTFSAREDGAIVYGHHRLEAAKRVLGKSSKVPVEFGQFTDEEMIRRACQENGEEFNHDWYIGTYASVDLVINAYAAGAIELEQPDAKTRKDVIFDACNATRSVTSKPFTALTVARFLGWTKNNGSEARPKVRVAVDAWDLARKGVLQPGRLRGIGFRSAKAAVQEAENAYEQLLEKNKKKIEKVKSERDKADAILASVSTMKDENRKKHALETAEERKKNADKIEQEVENSAKNAASATAMRIADDLREGAITVRQAENKNGKSSKKKKPDNPVSVITEGLTAKVDKFLLEDSKEWITVLTDDRSTKRIETLRGALLRLSARAKNRANELNR